MRYLKKIDKFDQNHLFLGGRWALKKANHRVNTHFKTFQIVMPIDSLALNSKREPNKADWSKPQPLEI
jgi:hypothetical protein